MTNDPEESKGTGTSGEASEGIRGKAAFVLNIVSQ